MWMRKGMEPRPDCRQAGGGGHWTERTNVS